MANPGPKLYFSQFGGEQPIPAEFIAAMERGETKQSLGDNTTGPEALSNTVVESKVETNRDNERVRTTVTKKPGNITLLTINTNDQGQPVQITRTLFPTGTTPALPSATQTVAVHDLGNGWSIQEAGVTGTYVSGVFTPGVFAKTSYDVNADEILREIPPEFLALLNVTETAQTIAGQATLPTLGAGDLDKSDVQETEFTHRTSVKHIDLVGKTLLESSREGLSDKQGSDHTGNVTLTKVLSTTLPTIDVGLLILESNVKDLGFGFWFKQTKSINVWPTLVEAVLDKQLGIVTDRTKSIVAAGTANPAGSSQLALDTDRTLRITETVNAASLAAVFFKFPGTTDIDVPPELISVTGIFDGSAGAGAYSESGSYGMAFHGTGGVTLHCSAQGSASVVFDVDYRIKQVWGRGVPCTHLLFIDNDGVSRASILSRLSTLMGATVNDWPKFVPQAISIVCIGQKTNSELVLNAHATDATITDYNGIVKIAGYIYTAGNGVNFDIGNSTKTVRIPPTIHAALSVGGVTTHTESYTSSGSINNGATNSFGNTSGSATGRIPTTSIGATIGQQTIPTSGLYLAALNPEPYQTDTVKFHAVIVDFATVN